MFGIVVIGAVIVLFLVMGCYFLTGKGGFLVAGYNTKSAKNKAKYDERALCRSVGWVMIAVTFCLMLLCVAMSFDISWLLNCAIGLMIAIVIGYVIYANTGNRFRKSADAEASANDGTDDSSSLNPKRTSTVTIVITIAVCAAIGVMLFFGEKEPAVHVFGDNIRIDAMYGLTVDFSDVEEVSLIEESMEDIGVGTRVNGYGGAGEALKGHFKSKDLGRTLLFIRSESSPTIRIARDGEDDIYISFRDGERTEKLYREMSAAVSPK
ncbi:MAG: DUF3784 domain-containing protein [Clostridiales Family XIII bacterium]|jgi:uncharacterized membrane protein|nr:DUF3784 domain-containing protein [Clostridiales Family XIII bacterium]